MKTIAIDCGGNNTSWSIKVSDLRAAVYQAVLFDKDDITLQTWQSHHTPDTLEIASGTALDQTTLWFQVIVMDPADTGGPYTAEVSIIQKGAVLGTFNHSASIPAGSGQMDQFTDEIKLACK